MSRSLSMLPWIAACGASPDSAAPAVAAPDCAAVLAYPAPPASTADVANLLALAQDTVHPDLMGVRVELVELESEADFFVANLDLSTVGEPGRDRTYTVGVNPWIFIEPPPAAATGAILAHELQHIADYVDMDAAALLEFGLWYASGDIAAYERSTDEAVLRAGCGAGLSAYRTWLYGQVDDAVEAEKRRDYYTPEEIAAWQAAHGR